RAHAVGKAGSPARAADHRREQAGRLGPDRRGPGGESGSRRLHPAPGHDAHSHQLAGAPSQSSVQVAGDFAPISLLASTTYVLVVHPSVPARTVKDLALLAKARPGGMSYA